MNADPIAVLSSALGVEEMAERLSRLESSIQVLSAKLEQRAKHEGSAVLYTVSQAAAAMSRPPAWLNTKISTGHVPVIRLTSTSEPRIPVSWTFQLAEDFDGASLVDEPLPAPSQRVVPVSVAARWLGIGLSSAHELRRSGYLPSVMIDGRAAVPVPKMVAWLENLMALSLAEWRERRRAMKRDLVLTIPRNTRRHRDPA